MTTGTVKWFNSTKGFGFIQPDNGGADAFVHISAVERAGMREIVEGQKISYELERDNKSGKMSACNLQAAYIGICSPLTTDVLALLKAKPLMKAGHCLAFFRLLSANAETSISFELTSADMAIQRSSTASASS